MIYLSNGLQSVNINKNLNTDVNRIRVAENAKTILDVINIQKMINKICLMKIDVETHEAEVIEGFASHIKLFRCRFKLFAF